MKFKFKDILCEPCSKRYAEYMSKIGKEGLKKRWEKNREEIKKESKHNIKVEALKEMIK